MALTRFPVIDPVATGANILRLRREQGFTVRDLQRYFGFEEPQAIYKWQRGQTLPSVDNLYALSALLGVPMNEILVPSSRPYIVSMERQAEACRSDHPWGYWVRLILDAHLLYDKKRSLSLNCRFNKKQGVGSSHSLFVL